MLTTNQIHQRAGLRYTSMLKSWGQHEEMFPVRISLGKVVGSLSLVCGWVEALKSQSGEVIPWGYRLVWKEVNSQQYGKNEFPTHLEFTDPAHLAKFLDKELQWTDFDSFMQGVQLKYPQVLGELRVKPASVHSIASSGHDFFKSLNWMLENPLACCYLREIPDLPHSKFIEENSAVFRFFLNRLLPADHIRHDEDGLERRFGFKKREHFFICRLLDTSLKQSLGWPCEELALSPTEISQLNPTDEQGVERVIIVENQVNLHTLPRQKNTLAIHGAGFAVLRLASAVWLQEIQVTYWGDLDAQGFEILSDLRNKLPKVKSLWMDPAAIRILHKFISKGSVSRRSAPNLTPDEQQAYRWCRLFNKRIEQERVPKEMFSAVIN